MESQGMEGREEEKVKKIKTEELRKECYGDQEFQRKVTMLLI